MPGLIFIKEVKTIDIFRHCPAPGRSGRNGPKSKVQSRGRISEVWIRKSMSWGQGFKMELGGSRSIGVRIEDSG